MLLISLSAYVIFFSWKIFYIFNALNEILLSKLVDKYTWAYK